MTGDQEVIPEPPGDLHRRELPLTSPGEHPSALYRCHRLDRPRSPVAFNFRDVADRFNDPEGEYGVLYLGGDPFCAFIETFGSSIVSVDLGLRIVSERDLGRRYLCQISVAPEVSPLRLVNLADGYGFSRLGIDGRISTTKQRDVTRRWSRALWSHPQQPDGLLYRACNDQERLSVVLFDRVGDVLAPGCDVNLLRDPYWLGSMLDHYAIGLDPD